MRNDKGTKGVHFLAERSSTNTFVVDCTSDRNVVAHRLIPELRNSDRIPIDLYVKQAKKTDDSFEYQGELASAKDVWKDLMPNTLSWYVMSSRLKDVIEANLAGKESIIWMSVEVRALNETRTYYVPRFTTLPDVIDVERTTFVSETDHIIKPAFSLEKLVDYAIFCIPQLAWEIPSGLYVTDTMREAIERSMLTGIALKVLYSLSRHVEVDCKSTTA